MDEIFNLIKDLLHSNTCIAVPGLGGFVANKRAARVEKDDKFCPPTFQIIFNAKLDHNDGLLTQEIAKKHALQLNEADKELAKEVADFRHELQEKKQIRIEGFGQFTLKESGIAFDSEIGQDEFPESYGLKVFRMTPLKAEAKGSSLTARPVLAAAATAAILLLVVPAMLRPGRTSNLASLNPFASDTQMLTESDLEAAQKTGYDKAKAEFDIALEKIGQQNAEATKELLKTLKQLEANTARTGKEDASAGRTATKTAGAQTDNRADNSTAYYNIVLKQFEKKAEAEAFAKKYQPKTKDKLQVMALEKNCYAVRCARTKDIGLAMKMMNNVRNKSAFKETFIAYK